MSKIEIVVIGSGSIGKRHADNLTALGAKVELLSMRALGLDGILSRIAAAKTAQGAVIATATKIRQPLIEACSARGLPVYVEKPVAYKPDDLAAFYDAAADPQRSMAGFMMRYHPLMPHLRAAVAEGAIYRFECEIGHDVTQWRQNWSFAGSYAADPEGGGVLLDLCHELDLAHTLFPDVHLETVQSLGHKEFARIDMATHIALGGAGHTGSVAMDYLSPVSIRRLRLRGQKAAYECDLLAGTLTRLAPDEAPQTVTVDFDRNRMFMDAMADFLALIEGRSPPSASPVMPRLDLARPSCELIAKAWDSRAFGGVIEKDFT